jgi:hypothetical protein
MKISAVLPAGINAVASLKCCGQVYSGRSEGKVLGATALDDQLLSIIAIQSMG